MSRTVNVNEEFVVVSEGKKDTGKFAILGNDGKFDLSVIPEIEDLQKQIDKLKAGGTGYDVLWSGNVGTTSSNVVTNTITLSKSLAGYNKIGMVFYASDGKYVRPQYREFMVAQFTTMINDSSITDYKLTGVWGFANYSDYSEILKTSTYTSLNLNSVMSFITEIHGIY